MRTTSPLPVYRSSRDTRNAPLWNPSSKELQNVEEDEAGRLAGFRARFGKSFDANKEMAATTANVDEKMASEKKAESKQPKEDELGYDYDEDDASLLEMISSYGTADKGTASQIAKKKL